MDGLTLLNEARQSGLEVRADADRLVVRGPRRLEALARSVLARKPTILEALAHEEREVAWRVDVMRPQATRIGALPLLVARPRVRFPLGTCCSCGDVLAAADRYRCRPCAEAAVVVLADVR